MQEEISFIDNGDRKTVTIINSNKIIMPSVEFVNNEYGGVSNDIFNLAFK